MMLASLIKAPELEIDENEAKKLAEALGRVQRHYPVLQTISPKAIDHANFVSVLTGVYGTRLMAMKLRKASEKASPIRPTVVNGDFGGNGFRG